MTRAIDYQRVHLVAREAQPPVYARVLGLRHIKAGGLACFILFEGSMTLGILLALAELVSWWGVILLPASVAAMVKINDVAAGIPVRSAAHSRARERERVRRAVPPPVAVGRAAVPGRREDVSVRPQHQASGARHAVTPSRRWSTSVNAHPVEGGESRPARRWRDRTGQVDTPQQRARQSASRRYE